MTGLQRATLAIGGTLSSIGTAASAAAGPIAAATGVLIGLASAADMIASVVLTGKIGPRKGSFREKAAEATGGAIAKTDSFVASKLPDAILRGTAAVGNETSRAELGRRKANEMEAAQAERRAMEKEQRRIGKTQIDNARLDAASALQPRMQAVDLAKGPDKLQAIDRAQEEIGKQRQQFLDINVRGGSEGRLEQAKAVNDLYQTSLELTQKRQAEEKDILQTKRQAATVAIDASKQELSNAKATLATAQDRIQAIKQSLQSAAVNFAMMSKGDQKQLLDLSKRIQSGEQLKKDELSVLMQSGTGRSREMAEQQLFEGAKRGGFFKVEGVGMREQLKREERIVERQKKIVQRVENEITVKEEYVVSVDEAVETLKDKVLESLARKFESDLEVMRAENRATKEQQARMNNVRRQNQGG